jgi:ABC-type multidrug transport system fused ATPase/permease subunit
MPDHETDHLIQESLRTQVGKDVTVLVVAHRLQTIIDADRIVRISLLLVPYMYNWLP